MAVLYFTYHYDSPIGGITLASDGEALTGLWFDGQKYFGLGLTENTEKAELPVFDLTKNWLDRYFSGIKSNIDIPLSPAGSEFRKAVWNILLTIPYGKTMTYGEIAAIIAEQKGIKHMSAQAVGGAVGHNPISIIIPCHRVLGTDGKLTGYAGGMDKKEWLLRHEGSLQFK